MSDARSFRRASLGLSFSCSQMVLSGINSVVICSLLFKTVRNYRQSEHKTVALPPELDNSSEYGHFGVCTTKKG
jgi:hypothetical protein